MRPHRRGRALTFKDTLRTDMKYQEFAVNTAARSFTPVAQSCTRPRNPAPASSMNEENATRRGPSPADVKTAFSGVVPRRAAMSSLSFSDARSRTHEA